MRISYLSAAKTLILELCMKAMNDTLVPERLVLYSILFGEYPKFYTPSETLKRIATTEKKSVMLETAREEIKQNMAKSRIQRALWNSIPATADIYYQPGNKVLVWRENVVNNHVAELLGPFTLIGVDPNNKIGFISDYEAGKAIAFGIDKLNPYYPPSDITKSTFDSIQYGFNYLFSEQLD